VYHEVEEVELNRSLALSWIILSVLAMVFLLVVRKAFLVEYIPLDYKSTPGILTIFLGIGAVFAWYLFRSRALLAYGAIGIVVPLLMFYYYPVPKYLLLVFSLMIGPGLILLGAKNRISIPWGIYFFFASLMTYLAIYKGLVPKEQIYPIWTISAALGLSSTGYMTELREVHFYGAAMAILSIVSWIFLPVLWKEIALYASWLLGLGILTFKLE